MKKKGKTKPWVLDDLIASLRSSLEYSYEMKRINEGTDIPWSGPELSTAVLLASGDSIVQRLAEQDPEELKYSNKQPDAVERILICAVQLGIEQCFRMTVWDNVVRRQYLGDISHLLDELENGSHTQDDISDARRAIKVLREHIEDPGKMI